MTEKKNLLKKKKAFVQDKDEEYFRMSLLAYQLNNKNIQKVLTLDYKKLYKKAVDSKVPFNQYYEWLKKQVF